MLGTLPPADLANAIALRDKAAVARTPGVGPLAGWRGEDGSKKGDPLNLVVVGDIDALFAFVGRGWRMTQTLDLHSAVATAKSFLLGIQYDSSPVSPLYVFGCRQDLALQKPRSTIDERNHVRFWKVLDNGQEKRPVWLGAATMDRGVGVSHYTGAITHHIDADIDLERQTWARDLESAGMVTAPVRTGLP